MTTNRAIPQAGGEDKVSDGEGDGPAPLTVDLRTAPSVSRRGEPSPAQSTPQAMGGEWKLVPVEPTEKMIDATRLHHGQSFITKKQYAAMLAAAPSSPAPSSAKLIEMIDDDCLRDAYVKIDEQAALIPVEECVNRRECGCNLGAALALADGGR